MISGAEAAAIVDCTCQHDYQDNKYGAGKRVANAYMKKDSKGNKSLAGYRCTVCLKKHELDTVGESSAR